MYCYTQCPQPAAGHHWPIPLLDTPGHSQASLCQSLIGSLLSFFLGPGAHKVLFVPSKSLFHQSCVSSGSSMVGLMATSSKRAYAIPRSVAPRAPIPVAAHCWPILLRIHSNTVPAQYLWDPRVLMRTRFVRALWASLVGIGFDSKGESAPPTILLGLLLCPW